MLCFAFPCAILYHIKIIPYELKPPTTIRATILISTLSDIDDHRPDRSGRVHFTTSLFHLHTSHRSPRMSERSTRYVVILHPFLLFHPPHPSVYLAIAWNPQETYFRHLQSMPWNARSLDLGHPCLPLTSDSDVLNSHHFKRVIAD